MRRLHTSPATLTEGRKRQYLIEALESRCLLSVVPITFNILELTQVTNPDSSNPIGDQGDYYAVVKIGDNPEQSTESLVDNPIESSHFFPNWTFTEFVDPTAGMVPVTVKLFDSDVGDDQTVDIHSSDGETSVTFSFDPAGGLLQGLMTGSGDAAGDAEVRFEMFRSVPVTVNVIRYDMIDDPDDDDFSEEDGGDYNFGVKINDYAMFGLGSNFPNEAGFINQAYTRYVNPADPMVRVRIAAEDFDSFSGNERMDINPETGVRDLFLNYNIFTQAWSNDSGTLTSPRPFVQGAGDGDVGRIYFDITSGADSDGDGLPDLWETEGIDVNADGTIDLTLNTDPEHKDLFVEVDAMIGQVPQAAALQDVVDAFAVAPVSNPDFQLGITLHAILDETNIPTADWAIGFPEFDLIKNNTNPAVAGGFGTVAERASANAANILAAKRLVYRYSIFGRNYGTSGSSGQAEIRLDPTTNEAFGGNDFFVTLGSFTNTREQQAGTFMHELGHTLGIQHGGGDGFNRKPNYHSVMNYTWQFPALAGPTSSAEQQGYANSWTLDYSRTVFPILNEDFLSESAGIGGHAGHFVQFGESDTSLRIAPESGPVNWNNDGDSTDVNVSQDLNRDGSTDSLMSWNDWALAKLNFRTTRDYIDGLPREIHEPELTADEFEQMNQALIYTAPLGNGDDNLTLRLNGQDLEVVNNATNAVVATRPLDDTQFVQIIGTDSENDSLTVDFAFGGFFVIPGGILFDGRTGGNDQLRVVGTGATTADYEPANLPGAGNVVVSLGGTPSTIGFTGLEPVEISSMATLTLMTPGSGDVLAIDAATASGGQAAHAVTGTSSGISFESLTFFNVPNFTLDAAANDAAFPADRVVVTPGNASAGVASMTINTGTGGDTITVTPSTAVAVTVNGGADADTLVVDGDAQTYAMTATAFTDASATPARKIVSYAADIESLNLTDGTFRAAGTVPAHVNVFTAATLAGVGTLTGLTTVGNGGTVDPGIAGAGILNALKLAITGGTYNVQLNGLAPGTQHDQVATGTIDLTGATLTGSLGFAAIPGDAIVIIDNDGTDAVVGKFTNVAAGDIVTIGGKQFAIDYAYNGNDVALLRYGAELAQDPCDPTKTALFVSATAGKDTIRFKSATGNSRVEVLINGQSQGIFQPTGTLIAFGQADNDTIVVEMPSRSAWLYGQAGDDTLTTGNGNAILLGGIGNDRLTSGNGKDILIGGPGEDNLGAGNGEDLLIAGASQYETNSQANRARLCAIGDEWSNGPGGYSGHISRLTAGIGPGGSTVLNSTTLFSDTAVDSLSGGNGRDWFLRNSEDLISDLTSNETVGVV